MGKPRTADRMIDDRGPIVAKAAKLVEATFPSCSWLLCLLPLIVEAAGLAVHRKLRSLLPEHFASYFVFDREKILFVKW